MTLKWCVLTGALMIASVYGTFRYKNAVQNPPGVYTRWYDGTTERIDKFYPDGKLMSTTVYGDDGKTVLIKVLLTDQGAIIHSKVRRKDGKVEEKIYSQDGKILLTQTIWVGDESYFVAQRQFYDDGQLKDEVLNTEDGAFTTSRRMFNANGTLSLEMHVLPNADQESKQYLDGHIIEHQIFKANGDLVREMFFPQTEIVNMRITHTALTDETYTVLLAKDGTPRFSKTETKDGKMVVALYEQGKIVRKQTLLNYVVTDVEEVSPATGKTTRKLELDIAGQVIAIEHYRSDGTLASVKHLVNDTVETQDDYDSTGTRVIHKQAGGEAEQIDPQLLLPITPPTQEE